MQILSGLTLLIVPHTVDTKYDIQYVLEDSSGVQYSAGVADSYKTWVELFLIFAFPAALGGANSTWDQMADHLYDQLDEKGAFAEGE